MQGALACLMCIGWHAFSTHLRIICVCTCMLHVHDITDGD